VSLQDQYLFRYLLLFSIFISCVNADEKYSLRLAGGEASLSNLNQILSLKNEYHPDSMMVYGVDAGYLLLKDTFDWPLDIYLKSAFYYYPEKGTYYQTNASLPTYGNKYVQDDIFEGIIYVKAYWNFNFWKNRVRLGVSEGISYVSDIPLVERQEADSDNDNTSKVLNYLELSIDFDVGRLIRYKPMEDFYAGFFIKHRSGIFGLINGVEEGGNNYLMLSLEKNF
jgi:outer membrane protein